MKDDGAPIVVQVRECVNSACTEPFAQAKTGNNTCAEEEYGTPSTR